MKINKLFLVLLILILISCEQNQIVKNNNKLTGNPTLKGEFIPVNQKANYFKLSYETVELKQRRKIKPDFFEITQSEFNQFKNDNTKWFISSDGKNKLYFVPYTDFSITTAILTNGEIKDSELINLIQSVGIQLKDTSKNIKKGEIKSKFGIKIGLSKNEVKKIFGEPDQIIKNRNKLKLIWSFSMREIEIDNKVGGLKPFILESLEFKAEMSFIDNKLNEVIYKYEVP